MANSDFKLPLVEKAKYKKYLLAQGTTTLGLSDADIRREYIKTMAANEGLVQPNTAPAKRVVPAVQPMATAKAKTKVQPDLKAALSKLLPPPQEEAPALTEERVIELINEHLAANVQEILVNTINDITQQ